MAQRAVRREWQVILTLSSVLKPHRWLLPIVLTLGLLASALEGIGITLLIPLLRTFSKNADSNFSESFPVRLVWAGIHFVPSRVQFLAIIGGIVAVVCFKNVFSYASTAIFCYVESRVSHELRLRVFERILAMPLAQVEADQSGRLYNVLNTETWRTGQALNVFFGAVSSICTVIILFLLLLFLSWRLTVISLFCVAAIPIVSSMLSRRAAEFGRKTVEANCDLSNRIWGVLSGLRVIHSFGREKFEVDRFDCASSSVRDLSLKLSLMTARNGPVSEILVTAIIAGLALGVQTRLMDASTLAAFIIIVYRLQPRIRDVASSRIGLLGLQGAVTEVTQLAERFDTDDAASSRVTPVFQHAVKFEDVSFTHAGQETAALQGVSFQIEPKSTVAIVGASGAGKSTLLDLLVGFREPQAGRITIDDMPIGKLDLPAWRARLGIISQDPYIFDDTIRFNLLYGRPEASQTEIEQSALLADADGFIRALPQGYDTIVGERGVRLSGGQRQRLVLARALMRDPDLLILDEATNSVDSLTEQRLQQSLLSTAGNRTIIMVAHRLASVEWADNILVFDRGRLVEQGSFSELIACNGLFSRMHSLQSLSSGSAYADQVITKT